MLEFTKSNIVYNGIIEDSAGCLNVFYTLDELLDAFSSLSESSYRCLKKLTLFIKNFKNVTRCLTFSYASRDSKTIYAFVRRQQSSDIVTTAQTTLGRNR